MNSPIKSGNDKKTNNEKFPVYFPSSFLTAARAVSTSLVSAI